MYSNSQEVQFSLSSSVPWNCMDAKLVAKGEKMKFNYQKGKLTTMVDSVDGIDFDTINVGMSCSNFYYPCEQFTVSSEWNEKEKKNELDEKYISLPSINNNNNLE